MKDLEEFDLDELERECKERTKENKKKSQTCKEVCMKCIGKENWYKGGHHVEWAVLSWIWCPIYAGYNNYNVGEIPENCPYYLEHVVNKKVK